MMLFVRPAPPPGFIARVGAILAGSVKETEIWREYKSDLVAAQHGRCGYCDSPVSSTGHHDVDHYRPKGEVHEINDGEAEAKCRRNAPPKTRELSKGGYGWLRYEWTNFVYACQSCNQIFKRCLFPVKDGTRTWPLDQNTFGNEESLLLWCYGIEDPANHLEFTKFGGIAPKNNSAHGLATILTCGLSRMDLRNDRQEKCEDAFAVADDILAAKAANDGDALADCLAECVKRGASNKPWAGVFRIIVTKELGLTWNEVLALQAS